MDSCSPAGTVAAAPFSSALTLVPADAGVYGAELPRIWTVGGGKLHGGFLLALLTKAGLAGLAAHPMPPATEDGGGRPGIEPVAVSAEFLRAPEVGPAELATEVLKVGRTVSTVRVALRQHGRAAVVGTVTAGRLPDDPPSWSDLPTMAAEPPPGMPLTSDGPDRVPPMAHACQVVLDLATASFTRGERGTPLLRGWVRPLGEAPDLLFTLVAGDILPPLLFNLGRVGWVPTVQLTALLRGRPAPGWLRLEAASRTVRGDWLDEDYTVVDGEGRLVCQARQLALAPLDRPKS
jgi:acyl-coenzyme A thioesterase PaaI-like protein